MSAATADPVNAAIAVKARNSLFILKPLEGRASTTKIYTDPKCGSFGPKNREVQRILGLAEYLGF
jgi:hypothetical protein